MSNVGGKLGALADENHQSNQSNSSSRRLLSTTSCKSSKIRCSECEVMFQPKGEEQQKLCTECTKGKPRAKQPVDHIYSGNFQSTSAVAVSSQVSAQALNAKSSSMTSNVTSCSDSTPAIKRMMPSQNKIPDNGNKRKRLHEGNSSNPKEPKSASGPSKQLTVVEILSSDDEDNGRNKQVYSGAKEASSFPLPIIIKTERTSENETGNNVCTTKSSDSVEKDVSVSSAGPSQPFIDPLAVSLIQPGKAGMAVWAKGISGDSVSPISVPAIQNAGQVSLEALKLRESELTQLIVSISSDSAVNDSVFSLRQKILELKRKRSTYQDTIASKEAAIKALDAECNRLLVVVDACKKERDGVDMYVKDAEAVIERAKLTSNALEEQVISAQQSLAEAKDVGLVSLLRGALKIKERRFVAAKDEVTRSADLLKEAQEDLQKAEEELKANETAYQKSMEQAEKERSEFLILSESRYNTTEEEITYFDSQLKSLAQSNKKKVNDVIELEEQLLDIQYMRKKKELKMKKKIMTRWMPSSP